MPSLQSCSIALLRGLEYRDTMKKTVLCFIFVAVLVISCTEASLWSFPGVEKHTRCLAQCNPVGNGTQCGEGCTCRHKVDQPEYIGTCLVTEIDPAPIDSSVMAPAEQHEDKVQLPPFCGISSDGSRVARALVNRNIWMKARAKRKAGHLSSGAAEMRQLLGEDVMPLPTVTDEQPAVNSQSLKVQPGTQVVPFQGDIACFSSRAPFPPWPPGYLPYAAPAFSQSKSSYSTMSLPSSSDSLGKRMETQFLMSDSAQARSRTARSSTSTMDSTISYDSFARTRTMDSSSQEKATHVEVSVDAGRSSLARAFASTMRAVIETVLPRKQNHEMTIKTTFKRGRGEVPGAADRIGSTGCQNSPPPPPPPGPPPQSLESLPKGEPIKVAVAQVLNYQPLVESLAPAKPSTTTSVPSVLGPAVSGRVIPVPTVPDMNAPCPVYPEPVVSDPIVSGQTVPGPHVHGPILPISNVPDPTAPGPAFLGPEAPGKAIPGTTRRSSSATAQSGPVSSVLTQSVAAKPVTATLVPAQSSHHTTANEMHPDNGGLPPANVPAEHVAALKKVLLDVPQAWLQLLRNKSRGVTAEAIPEVAFPRTAQSSRRPSGVPTSTEGGANTSHSASVVATTMLKAQLAPSEAHKAAQAHPASGGAPCATAKRDQLPKFATAPVSASGAATVPICPSIMTTTLLHEVAGLESQLARSVPGVSGGVKASGAPLTTRRISVVGPPTSVAKAAAAKSSAEKVPPQSGKQAIPTVQRRKSSLPIPSNTPGVPGQLQKGAIVGTSSKASSKASTPNVGTPRRRPSVSSVGKAVPIAKNQSVRRLSTPGVVNTTRKLSMPTTPAVANTARKLSTSTTAAGVSATRRLSTSTIPGVITPHATQVPARKSTSQPAMASPSVSAPVRRVSSDTAITGHKAEVHVPPAVVPDHSNVSGVEILHQLQEQAHAALQPLQTQRLGDCHGNQHTIATSDIQITIRPTSSDTRLAGPKTAAPVQTQHLGYCHGNQHTIVTPTLQIRIRPTSSDTTLAELTMAAPVTPGVVLEADGSNQPGANILQKVQEQVGAIILPVETVLPPVVQGTAQKTGSTGSIHAQPAGMETDALQGEAAANSEPLHAHHTEQGIVALPPQEQTAHEVGGRFPGLEVLPPCGAEDKPPEDGSAVPLVGTANAPLPGAPMQWRELSPSAAAPSPAAPSPVAPRFLPRPERMGAPPLLQGRFPIMPPGCPPGTWRGHLRGGPEQPTPRQPLPGLRPPPMRGPPNIPRPQPVTQYAEIKWSMVSALKVPFSTESSSLLRHEPARKEPLHGEGEGAPDKPRPNAKYIIKGGEDGCLATVKFEEALTLDRVITMQRTSMHNLEILSTPLADIRDESEAASAKTALAMQPLIASIVRKAKGKINRAVQSPKAAAPPRKGTIKTARKDKSKTTRSDTAQKVAEKGAFATRHDLKTNSLHEERHSDQSKRVAGKLEPDFRQVEANEWPHATKPQPSTTLIDKPPTAMKPVDVNEAHMVIVSPYEPLSRPALNAVDGVPRPPASPGFLVSAEDVVLKHENDSEAAVDSDLASVQEQATAPTAPRRESSTFPVTRKSHDVVEPPTMQQLGSNTTSTWLEKVGSWVTPGNEQKEAFEEENKSEKRAVQTTVEQKLDPGSEENQEALVNTEPQEENAENKRVRVNRQESRESRAAPTFVDEGPSWPLLGCALGLVGVSLMLLLALVYSMTTSVLLPPTTQATSLTSTEPGIIYCSSQFCDREADYIKTLLSASGKGACENFYEHVCGAWPLAHPMYSSTGTGAAISTDTIIQDRLDEAMVSLLTSSNAEDVGISVDVYEACVDRNKADTAANDVKELFKTWTIRQWPRDVNGTMKDVWNFAGELVRDLGLSSILDVVLAAGSSYSDKPIVELRKPTHIFLRSGASRPPVISLFRAALRDLASEFTQAPKADILEETTNVFIRLGSSSPRPSVLDLGGTKFTEPSAATVRLSELDAEVVHFLTTAFDGAVRFEPTTLVILRPLRYLRDYLVSVALQLVPHALMNYMGFLALVHLSAFLPERHVHLRQLFAKDMRGRTVPDVSNSSALCAMSVERILPACFTKLSSGLLRDAEYDARVPEKLSQLEDAFARNIGHLVWISDEQVLVNRYRIKHRRASQLGPAASTSSNDSCGPSQVSRLTDSPVEFYRAVSRAQQYSRWQRAISGGAASSDAPIRPSSVRARFDHSLGRVLVPAALFNTSVPGNSTGFSLQLARYAVRFYRALLEALFVDERGHFDRNEASRHRLEMLLQCFEWDMRELPTALRGPVAPDPAMSRGAVLQQTAALQLAFRAFQELWQVRRAWNVDFRYERLPGLSAEALFFVYYALDNCENSDLVYKEHQGHWLSAEYRVNLPLRHLVEFSTLFNCSADTNMGHMGLGRKCAVVTPDTWTIRAPANV